MPEKDAKTLADLFLGPGASEKLEERFRRELVATWHRKEADLWARLASNSGPASNDADDRKEILDFADWLTLEWRARYVPRALAAELTRLSDVPKGPQ